MVNTAWLPAMNSTDWEPGATTCFCPFPICLEAFVKNDTTTQDSLFRTRPGSAIRLGEWKLIQYFENNDIELYNLKNDVGEKNNLASHNSDKVQELTIMLDKWRKLTGAAVPEQLNPEYLP